MLRNKEKIRADQSLGLQGITLIINPFNNDIIHGKSLEAVSLYDIVDTPLTISCSPLLCQYTVGLGSIFAILENSLRTKLTDFSAFP